MADLQLLGAVGIKVRPDARHFRRELDPQVRRELRGYEAELEVKGKVHMDTRQADRELDQLDRRIGKNRTMHVKVDAKHGALDDTARAAQRVRIQQIRMNEQQAKYGKLIDQSKQKLDDLKKAESYVDQPDGTKLRSDKAAEKALRDAQNAVRRAQRQAKKDIAEAEAEGRPTTKLRASSEKRIREAKEEAAQAAKLLKAETKRYEDLQVQVKEAETELRSHRAASGVANRKAVEEITVLKKEYQDLADVRAKAEKTAPTANVQPFVRELDKLKRNATAGDVPVFRDQAKGVLDQMRLDAAEHVAPIKRAADEARKAVKELNDELDSKSRQYWASPKHKDELDALNRQIEEAKRNVEELDREVEGRHRVYVIDAIFKAKTLRDTASQVEQKLAQDAIDEEQRLRAERQATMDRDHELALKMFARHEAEQARIKAAADREAEQARKVAEREQKEADREKARRDEEALKRFKKLVESSSTADLLRNRNRVDDPAMKNALVREINTRLNGPENFREQFARIRHEADKTQDHIDHLDPELKIKVSGLLAASRAAAWVARTRVANILVKLDQKSVALAMSTLSSLSGFNMIKGLGTRFTDLLKDFDEIAVKASVVTAGVAALTNSTLWLVGSLANVAGDVSKVFGLLAAAPAGLAASAAILTIAGAAFKNFGEAVNGSDEHLAAIPPNARNAAMSLRGAWKEIQRPIQGNFWEAMGTSMEDAVHHVIPQFAKGLADSATGAGLFTAGVLRSFQKIAQNKQMETMFSNLSGMFGNASGAAEPLFDAINRLGLRGSEFLPRFGQWITDISKQFDDFITKADANGDINRWIEEGITALQDLWSVGGSVLDMFQGIAQAADLGGLPDLHDMRVEFRKIADMMLAEPFKSRMAKIFQGGYDGAREFGRGVKEVGRELGESSDWFAQIERTAGALGGNILEGVAKLFGDKQFQDGTLAAIQGMEKLTKRLDWASIGSIIGDIGSVAGTLLSNVDKPLNSIIKLIKGVTDELGPDFQKLIPELTDTLSKMIDDASPLVHDLASMIGDLSKAFTNLPDDAQKGALGIIGAIALLGPSIGIIGGLVAGVKGIKGVIGAAKTAAAFILPGAGKVAAKAAPAAAAAGAAGIASKAVPSVAGVADDLAKVGSKVDDVTGKMGAVGGRGLLGALGRFAGNPWTIGIMAALDEVQGEIDRKQQMIEGLKGQVDPKTGQITQQGAKAVTGKILNEDGMVRNIRTGLGIEAQYKDTLSTLGISEAELQKKLKDPKTRDAYVKHWQDILDTLKTFGAKVSDEQLDALGISREQYDAAGSNVSGLAAQIVNAAKDIQKGARAEVNIWANTAPFEAAMSAVQMQGLEWNEADFKAWIDADPSRAERMITDAGDLAREYAARQYLANLYANNDPALAKVADALNVSDAYARGDFQAVLRAWDAATPEAQATAMRVAGATPPREIKITAGDSTGDGLTEIQRKLQKMGTWKWVVEVVGQFENFFGGMGGWFQDTFLKNFKAGDPRLPASYQKKEDGGIVVPAGYARAFANGGITGNVQAFANGAIMERPGDAKIYSPTTRHRIFSEETTGGEAYIPMGAHKRIRSTQILSEVARSFGFELTRPDVSSFGNGAIAGGPSGSTGGNGPLLNIGQFNQHASSTPEDVARALHRQLRSAPGGSSSLGRF